MIQKFRSIHQLDMNFVRQFSTSDWFNKATLSNPQNLPRLPIPNLEDTIPRYLATIKPLVSPEIYRSHEALVKDFVQSDGRRLHQKLIERDAADAASGGYPFSYIERDWDKMYLGARYPNPINVNPGYGLVDEKDPKLQAQLPRTARFISSILKFSRKLTSGKLEVDPGNQCMSFFPKLFGTSRIPHPEHDTLMYNPQSSHMVVIRGSHYFKVDLLDPLRKKQLSEEDIQRKLEQVITIADKTKCEGNFVGILTTEDRNLWAQTRKQMISEDIQNKESLAAIDSALFILVLDEEPCNTPNDKSSAVLHGHGKNRWFDKLQLLSFENGHLGVNFEHSFSDGTVWNRWLHETWHDMNGTKSGFTPLEAAPAFSAGEPQLLRWNLSKSVRNVIDGAIAKYSKFTANNQTELLNFSHYGKNTIKTWKTSPDGVAQMAFQLAFYRFHGSVPPTYESCSTRSFLHGRTETIRSATNEAKEFVQTVSKGASIATQRDAFRKAVDMHVEVAKRAQKGMGVDRHLFALSSIAEDEGKVHPFFTDKVRKMSSSYRISSSNVTMPFLNYFCFGAVHPTGYGLGYLIHDESIPVNVTSFKDCEETDSKAMARHIEDALLDIRKINSN